MAVDVDAVLNEAGLIVRRDEDGWAVHGNTYPIRNLLGFLGGEYDPTISDTGLAALVHWSHWCCPLWIQRSWIPWINSKLIPMEHRRAPSASG